MRVTENTFNSWLAEYEQTNIDKLILAYKFDVTREKKLNHILVENIRLKY